MTGDEVYLTRIDQGEVDVWDYYKGDSVFHIRNSELPEWAQRVSDLAALAEQGRPIWAVLDKDFLLIRFSKEET